MLANMIAGMMGGTEGVIAYPIEHSLRLRSSASASLSRTPSVAGNRKLLARRMRIKIGAAGSTNVLMSAGTASIDRWYLNSSYQLCLDVLGTQRLVTNKVFRDFIGHIVDLGFELDVANATAGSRAKILENGVELTYATDTRSSITNTDTNWNNTVVQYIGRDNAGNYFDGLICEPIGVDGSTTVASYSTVDPNNILNRVPTAPSATWGANGFYIKFNDGTSLTTLGYDRSGNGNNWTLNGFSLTAGASYDWMVDTPTNNYATLNPLDKQASMSVSDCGLSLSLPAAVSTIRGSIHVSSGKWYWEVTSSASNSDSIGVANASAALAQYIGGDANGWGYYQSNGNKINNATQVAYGSNYGAGVVIGVALDLDNEKLWFSNAGVWQASGDPAAGTNPAYTGLSGPISPATGTAGTAGTQRANFGQCPFAYTPPTGFKALCTANLPAVGTAAKSPKKHFDVVTRAGTGATYSKTGLGFQPDLAWTKLRNTAYNHYLQDAVRGVTKTLSSNTTTAEQTPTSAYQSFNTDGYTIGTNEGVNGSGYIYVDWLFNMGGTTVTNTAGSISAQVRANPDAGMSVVTYIGTGANATVGHGLSSAPKMVIIRPRNVVANWWNDISNITGVAGDYLHLSLTNAKGNDTVLRFPAKPTSTVFSLGTGEPNTNGNTNVAYCFTDIPGFLKTGTYTGNGSTDGPFVFCGFKPRWLLVKRTDSAIDWHMIDSARDPNNLMNTALYPNLSNAENATGIAIDALANGFKLRLSTDPNTSGGNYIYIAIAEAPFGGSNIYPACAR